MLNIADMADGLRVDADGVWRAESSEAVSYPPGRSDFCFGVEESSFWFLHRRRCVGELAATFLERESALFDVGGGNGSVAEELARRGFRVWLVEPSRDGIENARRRGLDNLIHAEFSRCRFREGTLPNVGLFDVLEHVRDDHKFLRGVHRALADAGLLLLSVPAQRWLWSSYDAHVGHYRRYTRHDVCERLRLAGFAVEYATYLFLPAAAGMLLFRVLPDRLGLRRGARGEVGARQLTPLGRRAGRPLASCFAPEAWWIRRRKGIPLGTSCLVVARKPGTRPTSDRATSSPADGE